MKTINHTRLQELFNLIVCNKSQADALGALKPTRSTTAAQFQHTLRRPRPQGWAT